jgi:hypothetical protein
VSKVTNFKKVLKMVVLRWVLAATALLRTASGGALQSSASQEKALRLADLVEAHTAAEWQNRSAATIAAVLAETTDAGSSEHQRRLLAYAKLGKLSTLSFLHVARTGGLSFNKLLVENRGVAGRDGNRIPDCIVPRAAYGNESLPLSARFDFPHCEILSAIWPLPLVQVRLARQQAGASTHAPRTRASANVRA